MLTKLNTAIQAMALSDHAAGHNQGRIVFAAQQRDFATILTLDTPERISAKFYQLSVKFFQVCRALMQAALAPPWRFPNDSLAQPWRPSLAHFALSHSPPKNTAHLPK